MSDDPRTELLRGMYADAERTRRMLRKLVWFNCVVLVINVLIIARNVWHLMQ